MESRRGFIGALGAARGSGRRASATASRTAFPTSRPGGRARNGARRSRTAPPWCHPFNYIKVRKGADRVAGPGRMLDALRAEVNPEDDYDRQVFAFSDVVRIYDMLSPIDGTTALERVAAFSELIDRNGFGTMPRLVGGRKWTPVADVSLEEEVCAGMPLAVFGEVGSLTLRDGGPKARVFARDLAGGEAEDITAACARHDGRLTLPGDVLGRIGRSAAPGDSSSPGTLVEGKVR